MSTQNLAIGQKVLLNDGRSAVIRFKGATAFAPGDWVGVELEESSGKNDGSVQGQRYFDCADGHGMFLRSTGISKVVAQAPSKTAAARQSNGVPATKSRTSTVGQAGRPSVGAANGRSRDSILGSPTPSRGPPSRLSGLKSPVASPTKQQSAAGSSSSSRTSTPSMQKATTGHAAKSRASLAPASSTVGRRTSTLPSSTTTTPRAAPRMSLAGLRPGARGPTTAAGRGGAAAGVRTNIAARLSDHSQASSQSRATTAEPDVSSDGRSPLLTPESEARAGPEDEVDGTSEDKTSQDGGSIPEDAEATPRPVRTATVKDKPPSRTPSTRSLSPTVSATSVRPPTAKSAAMASREIEDLQTKLRVLEKRRLEDREKLKSLERLQVERDRFESIIQKLQQKYQPQQQELADLRRQVKDSEERFAAVEKLQADFDVELENAALDREMAEEQWEVAKTELAALREKYEEAELELEVLREENQELGKEMSPEERTSQGWLQLERSNERYREALIRLRDITQEQEAELRQQVAALEKELDQFSGINEETENLKAKLLESEAAIDDLKQQLELAQGGEEMLEELSDRNMALQERIEDLNATIDDLENLKELNDELEVNHVEAEKGMQEEIDFKDSVISDQLRRSQEQQKAIDDYEMTVARFREAFRNLQADLEDMRASKQITDTEAQELNSKSRALIDLNMKLQSSAAKTQIKTLDLELQRLEAEEAAQHLSIVRIFLPESYQSDRDSVLALLRFKRIAFKSDLIHGMIKERLADQVGDDLFSGCSVVDRLTWISAMSQCFINGISASSADDMSRFEAALHELEPVERGLNNYLDMLRREELQLKRIDAETERSMAVMEHLASTLLQPSPRLLADQLAMKTLVIQSNLESTATALSLCKTFVEKHSLPPTEDNSEVNGDDEEQDGPSFQPFFDRIDALASQSRGAKVIAGKIHREVEDLRASSMALQPDFAERCDTIAAAASQIALFARTAGDRLSALVDRDNSDAARLTPHRVVPVLTSTANEVLSPSTSESAPFSTLHSRLASLSTSLTDLHAQTTDLNNTVEFTVPPPPWLQRSQSLKDAAASTSADKAELQRLNEVLRERNLAARARDSELDEQSVRIEMLEARMADAGKRTARIEELEAQLARGGGEATKLRAEVERLGREARRLREERDGLRARVGELDGGGGGGGPNGKVAKGGGADVGDQVVGKAARLELQRRRVQVDGLRATVRFLHSSSDAARYTSRESDDADLDWLRAPLVAPPPPLVPAASLLRKEAADVMLSLLDLTLASSETPIRVTSEKAQDRLKWRPARDTNAWVVGKRREEYAVWCEWKDRVVDKAAAFERKYANDGNRVAGAKTAAS